jgi:S-adenosylmethionine:tRNA ribosyltransferase-isomerase
MKLTDFDYHLPPELIAQHPVKTRTASRLLHVNGGQISDRSFPDLVSMVNPNDVLVFNDTKVIKARLHGRKETGGTAEVLIERVLVDDGTLLSDSSRALAHIRASKSPKPGSRLLFAEGVSVLMVQRVDDLFELRFENGQSVYEALEKIGEVPLPPYITHQADIEDESRYQTVYAKHQGSVAAPTAGLHFDEATLSALADKGAALAYVTLHVGAGTFRPVRDNDITKHVMHSERYDVPQATVDAIARAKASGGSVIAVGTTSTRTLEAASREGVLRAGAGETKLFITPGFAFHTVDRMVTNFHLPKSTLLMLVSAFAGYENVMRAYEHSVQNRYRFFSYGDAMLLERVNYQGGFSKP